MNRIDKLMEFLRATPNDSFLCHALALEYIKEGRDSEAEQIFTELLLREPGYTGSYYHLGKLMERKGNTVAAITTYKKGMEETRKISDRHAYAELQAALEELED